jgi:hypothetical protein
VTGSVTAVAFHRATISKEDKMTNHFSKSVLWLAATAAAILYVACGPTNLDSDADSGSDADTPATCIDDGFCDPACSTGSDPDCCLCDQDPIACNAASQGSTTACACDPNCSSTVLACGDDNYCDPFCTEDPNNCDYYDNVCEAIERDSTESCNCDVDCDTTHPACDADSHCDTWCPDGEDPDCTSPTCPCEYFDGICESEADGSTRTCNCDTDCGTGDVACQQDNHCDNFCDPNGICKDVDCQGTEGSGYLTGVCDRTE